MLRLEKITHANAENITALSVSDKQKTFVADNAQSLSEAQTANSANGHAFPFGIYDGNSPVGFVMIGFGIDNEWADPPEIAKSNYNIWRLMIDKRYQGKGYGKGALKLALDFIQTFPCGTAQYCWVSYAPENTAAESLYHLFGFTKTNFFDNGELIAVLTL